MRPGPNKRSRGRNNNGNPNQHNSNGGGGNRSRQPHRSQTFDSNGPGIKIRGNAYQVFERYVALAREASSSGDRVAAENLYQHAEHYFRILNANGENPLQMQQRQAAQAEADADAQDEQPEVEVESPSHAQSQSDAETDSAEEAASY